MFTKNRNLMTNTRIPHSYIPCYALKPLWLSERQEVLCGKHVLWRRRQRNATLCSLLRGSPTPTSHLDVKPTLQQKKRNLATLYEMWASSAS